MGDDDALNDVIDVNTSLGLENHSSCKMVHNHYANLQYRASHTPHLHDLCPGSLYFKSEQTKDFFSRMC